MLSALKALYIPAMRESEKLKCGPANMSIIIVRATSAEHLIGNAKMCPSCEIIASSLYQTSHF